MNEAALKKRLVELSDALSLPKGQAAGTATAKDASTDYLGRAHTSLEETLDYLRLQVKYLVFDLEATKRENSYLRRMLESRRRPEDDADDRPKW